MTFGTIASRSLSLTPVGPDPVICYRKNPARSLALKGERDVLYETRDSESGFLG